MPLMNNHQDPERLSAEEREAEDSRLGSRRRRRAHRSISVAITAAVIAVVLLLNLAVSYLGYAHLWQSDMTIVGALKYENIMGGGTDDRRLYTLSDTFANLIRDDGISALDALNEDRDGDPLTVEIIFCSERDVLYASDYGRLVLYTALGLQEEFPDHIKVSFVDVTQNPSAVQKYKSTSTTTIYSSNVIFACGTEYRVYALQRFFVQDESTSTIIAYNGEKEFASAILAVTRAESPIACFTTNHGERVEDCAAFRKLVESSGYIVQDIDLSREELPENCRLIITYDPQTDFIGFGNNGDSGVSEIDRLDKFLDEANSFLLFIDNETPELPTLEEYMEEWGVEVCRVENETTEELDNYHIRDQVYHLDPEGYTVIGSYGTIGLGASITKDMRGGAYPAKVVFPNATAIRRSSSYYTQYVSADEASDGVAYSYDAYYRNGVSRTLSNVFVSYPTATAEAFGVQHQIATEQEPFRLMTLTGEDRLLQEGNYFSSQDRSYVCVVGSTEAASDTVLESASYGNADMLSSTLRSLGREVTRVNTIPFKYYIKSDFDTDDSGLTTGTAKTVTILLTLLPAVVCAGVGVTVAVRRKYR